MAPLSAPQLSALMASGWSVASEVPLCIRHDDSGDEASGIAAEMVARQVMADWSEEGSCVPAEDMAGLFSQLESLSQRAQHYVEVAYRGASKPDSPEAAVAWETAFSLVFHPQLSDRVGTLLSRLGQPLQYDNPNGSYEMDVLAYAAALKEHVARLAPFLAGGQRAA